MKKTIVLLLIFLILFTSFTVQAGIKIWPGKLTIEMNKWFDEDKEIKHPIQIINPYSNGVNVTSKIENPNAKVITNKFSPLPDISWITTVPERLYLPPKSSGDIEVILNIPEDQKDYHYNEKWETRVVITSDIPIGPGGGGMNIELEIAVKLFIITPKSDVQEYPYIYILLIFIFSIIIVYIVSSVIKKKKENLESIYYFKNKK